MPGSCPAHERRLADRRVGVGQLVEEEHREVGGDQGDVDDREPAGRYAIRVGNYRNILQNGSDPLIPPPVGA